MLPTISFRNPLPQFGKLFSFHSQFTTTGTASVVIEADSEEEARQKLKSGDRIEISKRWNEHTQLAEPFTLTAEYDY